VARLAVCRDTDWHGERRRRHPARLRAEPGGDTIDEAVENSEEGTQAEDTGHTPSGNEPSGDSRGEQMKDVVEHDED